MVHSCHKEDIIASLPRGPDFIFFGETWYRQSRGGLSCCVTAFTVVLPHHFLCRTCVANGVASLSESESQLTIINRLIFAAYHRRGSHDRGRVFNRKGCELCT